MLGEGDSFGINGNFDVPGEEFIINSSKAKAKFCLSLHYNGDNSYLFVKEKKSLSLKLIMAVSTFQLSFLHKLSNKSNNDEAEEILFKGNVITMLLINLAIDKRS